MLMRTWLTNIGDISSLERRMDKPFSFDLRFPELIPTRYDGHIIRQLSAMQGQYADAAAFRAMLEKDDRVIYEVYEIRRPEVSGELPHGVSVVYPGRVGQEYFMTKGHFHTVPDTAEIYYCLKGRGMMVMETPEGDWAVEELHSGGVLYVPPRWAHRSVNTGSDGALVSFFIYPGHAGHDYGTIEQQGFRKLVVEEGGQPRVIDNPRWQASEARR